MEDKVTLPKSWQNKFKSKNLKDAVADIGMWFLFPCDYLEDPKRKLPPYSVRVPVESTANVECVKECAEKYFSMYKDKQIVSIPFSFSRIATLEGDFIKTAGMA